MDNLLDELVRVARRCDRAARSFEREPVSGTFDRVVDVCKDVGKAWCGSFLGYHAGVYIDGLRPPMSGERFDIEWGGLDVYSNRTTGPWREHTFDEIRIEVLARARVSDLDCLNEAAITAGEAFRAAKEEILPTLDAVLSANHDETLRALRDCIDSLKNHVSQREFAQVWTPTGPFFSRDSLATSAGMRFPHHLELLSWVMERRSWGNQVKELASITRQVVKYLERRLQLKGKTVAKTDGTVFIGHGGSPVWRDLKDFIQDRLGLRWEEFNREPVAGRSTKERLETMLDNACFAFLVMTAEDERSDGTKHARANVVHELGLFQGRLGFERAIVLLEEECSEFSNITGLTQIRFPKGKIMAKSEEIRRVLERENII